MTEPAPAPEIEPDVVGEMLRVLDLSDSGARTTEDIFTGTSQPMPHGRIYGGQVLAQSIVAASRTLPETRVPHSMHGYFLRPGDATTGLTVAVDRVHDGRSFSTRRAQAYQAGVPIFSMIASFQDAGPGLEHQENAPDGIPDPDSLVDAISLLDGFVDVQGRQRFFSHHPFEQRYVDEPIHLAVRGEHVPHQAVWIRSRKPLPDDPAIHRASLAYLSDMTIQDSVLRAHGVAWATPGLKIASLDHAMWWHRDGRVDDWLLYVQESPSARGGRGLATGRIYNREGLLLASVAQEIMIRVPEDTPGVDGFASPED